MTEDTAKPGLARPNQGYVDLRELLTQFEAMGEIEKIDGADWNLEIGALAETVAARIRKALDVVPADRIVIAPDCGMKYISRDIGLGKLKAMVAGAEIVRAEIG